MSLYGLNRIFRAGWDKPAAHRKHGWNDNPIQPYQWYKNLFHFKDILLSFSALSPCWIQPNAQSNYCFGRRRLKGSSFGLMKRKRLMLKRRCPLLEDRLKIPVFVKGLKKFLSSTLSIFSDSCSFSSWELCVLRGNSSFPEIRESSYAWFYEDGM